RVRRVARIHALRREGEEEVLPDRESLLLDLWQDHLLGGAGVRGALEHHELPLPEPWQQALERREDEGDVRLAGFPERRRHADQDGVGARRRVEGGGRRE